MHLLLADDHTLFRDVLLQYILCAKPQAEVDVAGDFHEALKIIEAGGEFDLVLLDLQMPGMDGLEGLKTIREDYPDTPVGIMSGIAEPEDVNQAINMGAAGYFPKTLSAKTLMKAIIQTILTGEQYLPIDQDTNAVMASYKADQANKIKNGEYAGLRDTDAPENRNEIKLTPRERDVLEHLAKGVSNKEIARELDLQVVTIKLHVRGICQKLNAQNRTQAALKARDLGLISETG